MSHWAPTVCIQLPTLLTNCAPHITANSLWAKGAHAELRRDDCVIVEKYLQALSSTREARRPTAARSGYRCAA